MRLVILEIDEVLGPRCFTIPLPPFPLFPFVPLYLWFLAEAVFNTVATIVALTIRSDFIDDANPELEAAGQVATSDPEELPMIGTQSHLPCAVSFGEGVIGRWSRVA